MIGARPPSDPKRSRQLTSGPRGPSSGRNRQRTQMIRENVEATSIPGTMPAMKRAPIDVSVITP